jgi:hypothetical protein
MLNARVGLTACRTVHWMHKISVNTRHNFLFETYAMFCMLYVFFWVIPRCLNFICRHFGTFCLFHLHRQVGVKLLNLRKVTPFHYLLCNRTHPYTVTLLPAGSGYFWANLLPYGYPNFSQILSFYTYLPTKMEKTECSEMSAYTVQMPSNYPEENIQGIIVFLCIHHYPYILH